MVIRKLGLEHPLREDCLLEPQKQWFEDEKVFIQKDCREKDEYVSWGAYHGCKSEDPKIPNISNISSYPTPIYISEES